MKVDGMKLLSKIVMRQITIADFAKKAGVPMATVYHAINGGRSHTRTAGKFVAALGIDDLRELLPDEDEEAGK